MADDVKGGGKCGLCWHDPACGSGRVTVARESVWLCHTDTHSCYKNWTVWGKRPPAHIDGSGGDHAD